MKNLLLGCAAMLAALSAVPASAQDYYGSIAVGAALLEDSSNRGAFGDDFVTGEGTTIPGGVVLPGGTSVGWNTEFDTGYAFSAAFGKRFGERFRGEVELAYQSNDIETHNGVAAGGIALDGEDAGVLITGSGNLGVSVGDLVDDGSGSVDSTFLMANAYYDFNEIAGFQPYVGAGVGAAFVNVEYSPSGVGIVDDEDTVLAYQFIAGAAYPIGDRFAVFGQYRYRATEDVETDVDLFDATLDVENRASVFEAGLRIAF